MSSNEPTWKKKTRPCPFYSQGRCLFAASCNFVHEVSSVKTTVRAELANDDDVPDFEPPVVEVHSPRSTRSPGRRLSGLLFALQDVIHPEADASIDERWTVVEEEETEQERHLAPVSPTDTTHLLSPVDISLRNMSFFTTEERDDSIDSGYAEWQGPQPMALSPPRPPIVSDTGVGRSPGSYSTLSLLSSSFGSPSSRLDAFMPRISASPYFSPYFTHSAEDENGDVSDIEIDGLDSSSLLQPFDEADVVANSTIIDANQAADMDMDEEEDFDGEGEATLRYAAVSPPAPAPVDKPNDSLDNIYDSYSVFSSPEPITSPATTLSRMRSSYSSSDHRSLSAAGSRTATPTAREPVFTPKSDMSPITLGSPFRIPVKDSPILSAKARGKLAMRDNLLSPPPSDLGEVAQKVEVDGPILSAKSRGKLAVRESLLSPPPSDIGEIAQEVEVSTKVPFGFRRSFSLGRAKNSSLMASRKSKGGHLTQPSTTSPELSPPPSTSRLRPLRLSTMFTPTSARLPPSTPTTLIPNDHHEVSPSTQSVTSSDYSISEHNLLSRPSIPNTTRDTPEDVPSTLSTHDAPQTAPINPSTNWRQIPTRARSSSRASQASSRLSEPLREEDEGEEEVEGISDDPYGETIRQLVIQAPPHTAPIERQSLAVSIPQRPASALFEVTHAITTPPPIERQSLAVSIPQRPASALSETIHAIATPRPTLLFAIASDDVAEVRRVLESGDAGPNDQVGPQSALAFTLTNDRLENRVEIIKTLLAFGADPQSIQNSPPRRPSSLDSSGATLEAPPMVMEGLDPALRYFVNRADAAQARKTVTMMQRTSFRSLTRVRFEVVGQDHFIEQLFRVLSMHSQTKSITPIVVLLCGPSGHGKSLMARKFGSLLEVPTHTVNMTTLRSTNELWQSYSMSPYEEPSTCTLAEFLLDNEGKRCVVVLDEIEKTESEKTLFSLLMPWEHGRCSIEAGSRHVDVKNVIWLATSNLGDSLVFEHHHERATPDLPMSREEYMGLAKELRPRVSARLGASLISRVTAVLPFVPFSPIEVEAIAMEALYGMGDLVKEMAPGEADSLVKIAMEGYIHEEGARCIPRLLSSAMLD